MKKWQKITGIAVAVAMILVAVGYAFYKYYLVPQRLSPMAEKISEYIKDDQVLDSLYEQAIELHNEGVLSDSVYTKFVTAYDKHNRDDLEYARSILDQYETEETEDQSSASTSLSARYASSKVGIEIIQTNDGDAGGKSAETYSSSRTSERTRAEDLVEAEKIINADPEPTDELAVMEASAYEKLKNRMTPEDFTMFTRIRAKLNTHEAKAAFDEGGMEGLKAYLRPRLTDEEYRQGANLFYSYADLFM